MKTHTFPKKTGFLLILSQLFYPAFTARAEIAQQPLFLTNSVPPLVMLTMGRDHKLYYEAYNDASDLDGDGLIDVGYKPGIEYYGYFDSYRCYDYNSASGGYFEPKDISVNKKCSSVAGAWSGDFLNYITTARIDALRKVLYGGFRSEDTTSSTVLKRSFIPQDAHSWGKEYDPAANPGYLISDYTPLSQPSLGTRHLFANVSLSYTGQPLMRVLNDSPHRIWQWVSIERPVAGTQCNNDNNSRTDCVKAGGTTWPVVPSTVLSNLERKTYNIAGTGDGHPANHIDFNFWVTNYAVSDRLLGTDTLTTLQANGNPFATDNYLTVVKGTLTVPVSGNYTFSVDGDDAVEVMIDGSVVAGWYGGHGVCNCNTYNGTIALTAGTAYPIEYRHEERGGQDSFVLRWERTLTASTMTDYSVNVKVCETGKLEANCKAYSDGSTTTNKPTGLLHTYGDNDAMAFGLITGSYRKNTSGGVLRKNIESFKNEVDPDTGIFTSTNGIVNTINKLRITTFSYSGHEYASGWITTRAINEGEAAEWGNPIAEMMYEGLRYFAGKAAPTSAFSISSADTPDATLGLPVATWRDPYQDTASGGGGYLSCAKPMQLVISDVNASYDTDQLPGSYFNTFSGDLSGLNVSSLADTIWAGESEASTVFIGQSGSTIDGAPTAKSVSSFKDIRGLAPEEPTKLGGFYAGSVALFGARNDLNPVTGDQKADTLAVALASPLPRIEIPVNGQTVTLVPFAKSVGGSGISATGSFQPTNQIVDFYVEQIVNTSIGNTDSSINDGRPYGKFRINYEDVEQAADHDMDAIVEYTFTVNADDQIVVNLASTYAAGGIIHHIGYVISGTTQDGVYLEVRDLDTAEGSDPDYFLDTPPGQPPGGVWADGVHLELTASRTFSVGTTTSASFINHDPLWYAAKWGVADKNNDGLLDTNEWDDDTNDVPDGYFLVTNAGKLSEQLAKAFAKLLETASSASAVAANTTRLDTGTLVYQAKFDPRDWSGQLLALSVDDKTGAVDTATPNWEAASVLPTASSRTIFTFDQTAAAGVRGINFLWSDITSTQRDFLNQLEGITDTLGEDRLNWLRGGNNGEKRLGGSFRDRIKLFNDSFITTQADLADASINTNKLGDIVNSDPIYVGTEDYGYSSLPGSEGTSYTSFRATSTYLNRRPMLYVGSNDGMLHGFDGRKNTGTITTGGTEVFAYIPNALFPELSKLTSPVYNHRYFVDGISSVGDAYFNSTWHSLLVGVTGAGGKAVFALDVTDPDSFGPASALWEFTSNENPDLGYTIGQPTIARMQNGSWAVIVANGYQSTNGSAVLFILDAATGSVIKKIDTGAIGANGLSSPVAADIDGDHIIDTIYAGDLQGNLWKFDVSSNDSANWVVANNGAPLFVACTTTGTTCSSANRQPITGKPTVGKVGADQAAAGVMIYFGTGKYFESTDNMVGTDPQVQTFYGLWDNNSTPIADRLDLQEQSIIFEGFPTNEDGDVGTRLVRVTTRKTVCYSITTIASNDDLPAITCSSSNLKRGWAMDLLKPVDIAQGERVVSPPVLFRDLVIFSTLIPSADPCASGGESRVMIVEALTGKRPTSSSFDLFGGNSPSPDGEVNSDDLVKLSDGSLVAASGLSLDIGIHKNISVIGKHGYASGSTGELGQLTLVGGAGTAGERKSWRQLL
ncbi:PA14 domain-containing protein [Methylicorpusculum oleiharenae]|uniref:PilC/PilY family type IV pilus protein n=1 Tax=Methylicorpusculum oleiharenae TaxID=1338687 RepID=UPI00135C47EE|nr:PilC/PilY family type IV pilus protein [Methylicorpusculum oleiharenae]MCD2449275.1 PA14 domain-containing protein [Methylicorpusculum oleiharenae]